MEFNDANIQNSQINEFSSESSSPTINNSGPVHTSGDGKTFIGCTIFAGGATGLEGFHEIQNELLKKAQMEIISGNLDQAEYFLELLIKPSSFCALGDKDQKLAIHTYCLFSIYVGREDNLNVWLLGLPESVLNTDLVRAWLAWSDRQNGGDGLEIITALLTLSKNSPSILDVALRCPGTDVCDLAISAIEGIIDGGISQEELRKYGTTLVGYSYYCSENGDYDRGISAINLIVPDGEVEALNLDCMRLSLNAQKLLSGEHVAHGHHLNVDDWNQLCELESRSNKCFSEMTRLGLVKPDIYALKCIVYSLKGLPEKAIKSIPDSVIPRLDTKTLINLANSYQAISDWDGLLALIDRVNDTAQRELAQGHAVALLNLNRFDEALTVEGISDGVRHLICGIKKDPDLREGLALDKMGGFGLASQVACQRYVNDSDSSSLEYIREYKAENLHEEFLRAKSLYRCKDVEFSRDAYGSIFDSLGAGIGDGFSAYLSLLVEGGFRHKVSNAFKVIPDSMLYNDKRLLFQYVDFMLETKGSKQLLSILSKAINKDGNLWLKVHWLHNAISNLNHDEIKNKVVFWGLDLDGSVDQRSAYLNIASEFVGADAALSKLYRIYHENPRRIEVLRSVFAIHMRGVTSGVDRLPESLGFVTEICSVNLSGKNEVSILIDDSINDTSSTHFISSDDERVIGWIGSKVGDEIEFEGRRYIIASISSPVDWLIRHSYSELPKRPEQSKVRMFDGESVEENVESLLDFINDSRDQKKLALKNVTDGKGMMLRRYVQSSSDMVSAWLDILSSEDSNNISAIIDINRIGLCTSGLDKCYVVDPTAAISLYVISGAGDLIAKSGVSVSVVHSVLDIFIKEKEDFIPKNYSYGWGAEHCQWVNDPGKSWEHVLEGCRALLDQVESKVLSCLDPVPRDDISPKMLEFVGLLDEETKGSIFASYGYEDRVLVSDDIAIRNIAHLLNVVCVNSYEFLQILSKSKNLDFSAEESTVRLASTKYIPNSISAHILQYMCTGQVEISLIDRFIERHLPNPGVSVPNARLIMRMLSLRFVDSYSITTTDHIFKKMTLSMRHNSSDEFVLRCLLNALSSFDLPDDISDQMSLITMRCCGFDLNECIPFSNAATVYMVRKMLDAK